MPSPYPPSKVPAPQRVGNTGDIAIIGMSGRFPGADSPDELWELLEKGVDTHRLIPPDRFDVKTHYDPSGKKRNTSLTPYGCFIERPDLFDTSLFRLSAREAAQTDPMQRLMLVTAYEALEMAGYSSEDTQDQIFGTYYGQSSDDWREVNSSQDIDIFHTTGGNRAFGPGRINYFFGWEGPSMSIDSACSASALSIQVACSALRSTECDTALAGGTNIMTAPDMFAGLSRAGFLSATGPCKTWDKLADGYCRADGVGSLVLKRMDDAIRDHDEILAVIRSTATNHSAKAASITHPHSGTQQALLRKVLQQALVSPGEVDYVEMHGTGTQAGDAAESASIASLFKGSRKTPLYVGTVKANVGHGEAASGVTSVIKAIKMFQKNLIPRHVGIKSTINPSLEFVGNPNIRIPFENTAFPPEKGHRRKILINNFNATGGNTSLLLEEGSFRRTEKQDPRQCHVIAFSAVKQSSLKKVVERMLEYISLQPRLKIEDVAYTSPARRMHHKHRLAYAVEDLPQLTHKLLSTPGSDPTSKAATSMVWLFTGQSALLTRAARTLFQTSKAFQQRLETISAACRDLGWMDIVESVLEADENLAIKRPGLAQMTLIALEIALVDQWKDWGLRPAVVIGHSLGEFAAFYAADVLSLQEALGLVSTRAYLLQSKILKGTGGMMTVKLSVEQIQKLLHTYSVPNIEIAAINAPNTTVVSGPAADLNHFQQFLQSTDPSIKTTVLPIPYAFHSSQMNPILDDFKLAIKGIRFRKPSVPIVSTLLGSLITHAGLLDDSYFPRQTRQAVRYVDALHAAQEYLGNCNVLWLEIGPSPVCISMVRSSLHTSPECLLASLDPCEPCWRTISSSMAKIYCAGIDLKWRTFHKEYEASLSLLQLPSYPLDLKSYWLQYKGDWCITKEQGLPGNLRDDPSKSLRSTTVHYLNNQESTEDETRFTFITDFANPDLNRMARGHLVNGLALCPSSIYADIAMTVAKICWQQLQKGAQFPAVDVARMEVFKPLIIRSDQVSQPIRIVASHYTDAEHVTISVDSMEHSKSVQHMSCMAIYSYVNDWTHEWNNMAYLYQSRIDHLLDAASQGKAHRMLKGMVYRLFACFVEYDESFQIIEEVILESRMQEATALVRLPPSEGNFTCDPHWIDGLAHLSGFILNGSDQTPSDTVYISRGWKKMQFSTRLLPGNTYRTYIRMQPVGYRGIFAGDLQIFDSDQKMAGVIGGITFQAVKRASIENLLGSSKVDAAPHVAVSLVVPEQDDSVGFITPSHSDFSIASIEKAKTPTTSGHTTTSADVLLEVLAKEIGVLKEEIKADTNLADLGMDSLLSVATISAFAVQTSIHLPLSLFADYPTFKAIQSYLEELSDSKPKLESTVSQDQATPPQCSSVCLQNCSNPNAPTLVLLPDGSGSAGAYAKIVNLSGLFTVIALNSPFQTKPKALNTSLEAVVSMYVSWIVKLDIRGPIYIGGWSIGGAYAYEAAFQMLSAEITIAGLLIIDCVSPHSMSPLPLETVEILEVSGVYSEMKFISAKKKDDSVYENLKQHFRASIRALGSYSPKPLSEIFHAKKKRIPCRAIWARHGVFELITTEKMNSVRRSFGDEISYLNDMQRWLLVSKDDDFGSHGWVDLLGQQMECEVVDGHHMSIMRQPAVEELSCAINRAINAMMLQQ